jgi:two-component system, cell cycle sensor histidine kinase and response regulator CckA
MSTVVSFPNRDTAAGKGLFRAALDVCPDGSAIIECGQIVYANAEFAATFRHSSSSNLQGRELAEFVPLNRSCVSTRAKNSAGIDCGFPGCEFVYEPANGTPIRIQASCSRFQEEGRNLLMISVRDLSRHERRRVVRDSDKRYRAIFDAAAIGILQCTIDGRLVESNPALQRMLGYSREELRGMHFREFTHPDDLATDLALFQEMVAGKRNYYQIELRYAGKQAHSGWVRLTVSLVCGPDGQPESVIGMVEDITERKQTEHQLREAQKMEVIGRLVGGVAHDFNNLLTGIMLYCDLLRDGLKSGSRLRHHAEEIRLAGEHGAALVQQLLSVARQQPVNPRVLSVNEVVIGTRNLLRRLVGDNIQLSTSLSRCLWPVKMDPAQVQQIILNLVLNARDAMPEGGSIRLETRNANVRDADRAIEFIVTDTGCGISEDVRSHLFEPFFTTKGPGQGNGLGLATVHSIVCQCGGSITVDSEPGRGTRVKVRLPRAQEEPATSVATAGKMRSTRNQGTILLVEDNSAVRRSALRILRESGYEVLEAANGAQALKLNRDYTGAIDLLLVDLMMPGVKGREVAGQLCSHRPGLRVLYISGYDQPSGGQESEPILLFRKPFTSDSLLQKVREVLKESSVCTGTRGNLS